MAPGRAGCDGDLHLLKRNRPIQFWNAPFELGDSDAGEKDDPAIGLKEELKPVTGFEAQILPHLSGGRRLVLAADSGFYYGKPRPLNFTRCEVRFAG